MSWLGAPAHTAAERGVWHEPCVCADVAQGMLERANVFNQPVAAWDVGKVTNMVVRRCPRLGRVLLRIQLPRGVATSRACVLARCRICLRLHITG